MAAGHATPVCSLVDGYGTRPECVNSGRHRRLLTLTVLHRASDLRHVRTEGWRAQVDRSPGLEDDISPVEEAG
jgi:hygromycin-B 7''-O-kinase